MNKIFLSYILNYLRPIKTQHGVAKMHNYFGVLEVFAQKMSLSDKLPQSDHPQTTAKQCMETKLICTYKIETDR